MNPRRRSEPEHIGGAARVVVDAASAAFAAGVVCTRRYIQLRASRPNTYIVGAVVEVRTITGARSHRHEHAADAGGQITREMRSLEAARLVGAEVVAYVERPSREPRSIVREVLVHRRLEERVGGVLEWVAVAPKASLADASAPEGETSDDEGGST